jgi:NitT/TauT family transport system substrate-binding protein
MNKTAVILVVILILIGGTAILYLIGNRLPPKAEHVRIHLDFIPGSEHAFLYGGKKFFSELGIDLEIIPGTKAGSSESAAMVDSKAVEFALCSGETTLQMRASEKPRNIVALAVFYPNTPAEVYSLEIKGITKPEHLYGKRLGVLKSSSAYRNYEAFAKKVGLDRSKITEVPTSGDIKEVIAADSQLDAMVHFGFQHPLLLNMRGEKVNEIKFREFGIKIYGQGLIAHKDLIETRRDLVERFVKAVQRAYSNAIEHPDEVLKEFTESHPEIDPAYARAKLLWVNDFVLQGIPPGKPVGYHDEGGWKDTYEYLQQQGVLQRNIQLTDAFNTSFLDPSVILTNKPKVKP